MLINKFIKSDIKSPPLLTRQQYVKSKIFLSIFVSIWFAIAILLFLIWEDIDYLVRILFIAFLGIFSIELGMFRYLFTSYDDYKENYLKERELEK